MFANRNLDPDRTPFQAPNTFPPDDPTERPISIREFNAWVSGANFANREFRRSIEAKSERQRVWIIALAGVVAAELVFMLVIAWAVWR